MKMHLFLFILFSFALIFNIGVTAKLFQEPVDNDGDRVVYQKYIELDRNLKKLVGHGIKMIFPYVMEANEHLNLSSRCAADLLHLISGIRSLKKSAFQILDANAKIPSGFVTGSVHMLGDYDECLKTDVLRKDGMVAFRGQYCMVHVRPNLPRRRKQMNGVVQEFIGYARNTSELMRYIIPLLFYTYDFPSKVGICVPSGCSSDDVTSISKYLGELIYMNTTVEYCDVGYEEHFYTGTIIAIVAFSLVGLLCLIGSLLDYISKKKNTAFKGTSARLLMCFSVISNFPKVISTKTSETALTSIFGVRSLSLFYIVLNHQYYCMGTLNILGHMIDIYESLPMFFYQIGLNGFLTTEVFFFLGGLLNTYTRMKIYETGKREMSKTQLVFHRLWRIYPAYLFSILSFFLFMNPYGPLGTHIRKAYLEKCRTAWWQNVLFLNNFFVQSETCMMHSWYIAADMQLFLLSLFTVPLLLRNAKRGLILHAGMLVVGIVMTALWAWHKNIQPAYLFYHYNDEEVSKVWNAYTTALPHIAPYYTGLICGYILFKWKDFSIPTIYQVIGWPLASAAFISMLFVTREWNSGVEYTVVESSLYFAFSRFLFTLAVAWLVLCCTWGYGGVLNYILSLKIWIPITRISYMVYLTSLPVQMNYFGSSKILMDSDRMSLVWRYVGDLGVTCLLGLAMVVVIESPFIAMEKILLRRQSTTEKKNEENIEDSNKNIEIGKTLNGLELENKMRNHKIEPPI